MARPRTASTIAAAGNGLTLKSIGELSAETGIPHHVLRYWETRFDQLRPVTRGTPGQQRQRDVERVQCHPRRLDQQHIGMRRGVQRRRQPGKTDAIAHRHPGSMRCRRGIFARDRVIGDDQRPPRRLSIEPLEPRQPVPLPSGPYRIRPVVGRTEGDGEPRGAQSIAFTISSTIFLASASSIIVLSR